MYFYDEDPDELNKPLNGEPEEGDNDLQQDAVQDEINADDAVEDLADNVENEDDAGEQLEQPQTENTTNNFEDEARERVKKALEKRQEKNHKEEEGRTGQKQQNQQNDQNNQENFTKNQGTDGNATNQTTLQNNPKVNTNPSDVTPNPATPNPAAPTPANANLANSGQVVSQTASTTSTATSTAVAGGEAAAGGGAVAGGAAAGLATVLFWVLIIILIIIIVVGVIMFFIAMPGQVSGKLKKLGVQFLDVCQALIHGKENVIHTEDLADVANYLESMGYDLKGEGFVSAEMGSTSKTYRDKEGNELVTWYDDEQDVWRSEDGKVVDITSDPIMTYLVSDNLAYIIKNFNSNLDTMTGGHGEEAFVIITTLVATFLSLVIFSPIALIAGTIAVVGGGSTLLFALTGNPNWGTGLISIWHEGSNIGIRRIIIQTSRTRFY